MDGDQTSEEVLRIRERLHDLENIMHTLGLKVGVLDERQQRNTDRLEDTRDTMATLATRGEALALADRLKELKETAITRAEFSPVQKIAFGLVSLVMGGFIMAVAMLVYHAGVK